MLLFFPIKNPLPLRLGTFVLLVFPIKQKLTCLQHNWILFCLLFDPRLPSLVPNEFFLFEPGEGFVPLPFFGIEEYVARSHRLGRWTVFGQDHVGRMRRQCELWLAVRLRVQNVAALRPEICNTEG